MLPVEFKEQPRKPMWRQPKGRRKHQGTQQKKWGCSARHKHPWRQLMALTLRCVKLPEVCVLFLDFYVCECSACFYVCAPCVSGTCGGQKSVLDYLVLESQTAVNRYEGAENQTSVLCKNKVLWTVPLSSPHWRVLGKEEFNLVNWIALHAVPTACRTRGENQWPVRMLLLC